MPPEAYFQNLPDVLCRYLSCAHTQIRIAVCWFTHSAIFGVLLDRLRAGVSVELLLEYDTQNFRPDGLDFDSFLRLGGRLYGSREAALMHHKFVLIDDRVLLTGSFNWTYSYNAENLIALQAPNLIDEFHKEFRRLIQCAVRIRNPQPAEAKPFALSPMFAVVHNPQHELRRRISRGAALWWVQAPREWETWMRHFQNNRLPIDELRLLDRYWKECRSWNCRLFDERWPMLSTAASPTRTRALRMLARRVRVGDIMIVMAGRQHILALGIVQSDPLCPAGDEPETCRAVQWLRTPIDGLVPLGYTTTPSRAGRFQGSGMRLAHLLFGQ